MPLTQVEIEHRKDIVAPYFIGSMTRYSLIKTRPLSLDHYAISIVLGKIINLDSLMRSRINRI